METLRAWVGLAVCLAGVLVLWSGLAALLAAFILKVLL